MLDMLTGNAGGVRTPAFMLTINSRDITVYISDRLLIMTLSDLR